MNSVADFELEKEEEGEGEEATKGASKTKAKPIGIEGVSKVTTGVEAIEMVEVVVKTSETDPAPTPDEPTMGPWE